MTFLNWTILAGLGAVAIPILIHLLNRRRARIVDWGAMQFLLASLASRNRRILFEEVLLMALRCLAVALLVLAMARPFLPSDSAVPWAVVLPAVLLAAMAAGTATVMWAHRRVRWPLLALAALLLAGGAAAAAWEHWAQDRRWSATGGEKDIVIVLDGSMSMTLAVDGKTNFLRAVEEAQAVVESCRPADAVGLVLGGSVSRAVLPAPSSDRQEIALKLEALRPVGGHMDVPDALNKAARALAKGNNAGKKIVLITDGQGVGWDVRNAARWRFLATALDELPTPAEIICRTLEMPRSFRNLAVADVALSRKVVGTDRAVNVQVKVLNTSAATVDGCAVELEVDGVRGESRQVGELRPNAAETVTFAHRFDVPGAHVVTARLRGEDDLAGDDVASRVVQVVRRLGVLLVDGAPSARPLGGAAAFLELALAPRDAAGPQPPGQSPPGAGAAPDAAADRAEFLVEPKVVDVIDVESIRDLRPFAVVVLADVTRLPKAFADDLAEFVRAGGGLLIAPGGRALDEFYAHWTTRAGEPVAPARLGEARATPEACDACHEAGTGNRYIPFWQISIKELYQQTLAQADRLRPAADVSGPPAGNVSWLIDLGMSFSRNRFPLSGDMLQPEIST